MEMLTICSSSDCGRVRQENQDHFSVAGLVVQSGSFSLRIPAADPRFTEQGILCTVADGMGGHAGGALASRIALDHLALRFQADQIAEEAGIGQSQWLDSAVAGAHGAILDRAAEDASVADMGATIVGVYLKPGACCVFHAGDSRLYRFRDGFLDQLTHDHAAPAPTEGHKPFLTNSLGGSPGSAFWAEIQENVSFRQGDRLLICSDGLTDMMDRDGLEEILGRPDPLEDQVFALVSAANEAGGADNITVMVIGLD